MLDTTWHTEHYSETDLNRLNEEIEVLKFEVQANGEMAESARLAKIEGTQWFNASEEDYEHEAKQSQTLLTIAERVYALRQLLEARGLIIVKNTIQSESGGMFFCQAVSKNSGSLKYLCISHHRDVICVPKIHFHALRRYCDNHQDDF